MASAQPGERTRKPLGWKRIVGYAISIVIVIGILVGDPEVRGLPGRLGGDQDTHADRDMVARRRDDLNLVTYWWANQAALPRPRHRQGRRAHADDDLGREHAPGGRRDRRSG